MMLFKINFEGIKKDFKYLDFGRSKDNRTERHLKLFVLYTESDGTNIYNIQKRKYLSQILYIVLHAYIIS